MNSHPTLQTRRVTRADMLASNVTRELEMTGSDLAFLDQGLPAHKREIINVIGMNVFENVRDPNLVPKIAATELEVDEEGNLRETGDA